MQYWYPYCRYRIGFCVSKNGCKKEEPQGYFHCREFRIKHPLTKNFPIMLRGIQDVMPRVGQDASC